MTDLWDHVSGARWFGSKGRRATPGRTQPLDWYVDEPELGVRTVLAEALLPDGAGETYQLLLSYRPDVVEGAHLYTLGDDEAGRGRVEVHDALKDPEALRCLVQAIAAGCQTGTWTSTMVRPVDLDGDLRVFGGEQSNTSVMVGDTAMVKFFRRLEPGANLDIAVHDALARAGVGSVARLYGWLSAHPGVREHPEAGEASAAQHLDLAMVVQQLPQARDGWDVATASAARGTDFTADAAALGRGLAQIHTALHDTFPTALLRSGDLAASMVARLNRAAAEAPGLADLVEPLTERFERLADVDVEAQRVHGDFHLGQTLLTADGWRIIDFEGEPIKSLAERSAPDSPWRDVAGMLRSLDYATSAAQQPDAEPTRAWLGDAQRAFLDGYTGTTGGRLGADAQALVDAYTADKAVYEVVYETRNRPDWVDIPLRALRALVDRKDD